MIQVAGKVLRDLAYGSSSGDSELTAVTTSPIIFLKRFQGKNLMVSGIPFIQRGLVSVPLSAYFSSVLNAWSKKWKYFDSKYVGYIVDDLVHASACGVDGCTPTGDSIKIFIDFVGFVADYPASADTIDVFSYVGRAPCTLCSFGTLQNFEARGPKFGYAITMHDGNSSFLRHAEWHLPLRRSDISERDVNFLGMMEAARAHETNCPPQHLCNQRQPRQTRIPRTSVGTTVVPGAFDPYRCNAVAPDHLLTGLSQDIVEAVFECLPAKEEKLQADVYICAALRANGLLPQREAFNLEKTKLNSMKLSELYCVILGAGATLQNLTYDYSSTHLVREAIALIENLQCLIALTYWWPQSGLDGQQAELFVYTQRNTYQSELKMQSKAYFRAVDAFCCTAPEMKAHLDKPNLHRPIELYEHTLPAFGHEREFVELVFETAHHPLKRCIQRSNNHDTHVFATGHCVGNDWQARIAALSRDLLHENESRRQTARTGLRRLLLGSEADMIDDTIDKGFIVETDAMLPKALTRALRIQFRKDEMVSDFPRAKYFTWGARKKVPVETLSVLLVPTGIYYFDPPKSQNVDQRRIPS